MWAAFLRAEPDRPGRLLRFGELLAFPVPFGIDDAAWRKDALSGAQPDIDSAILGESA